MTIYVIRYTRLLPIGTRLNKFDVGWQVKLTAAVARKNVLAKYSK